MTTRRDFIKKTVAGTAALSLGSILPGFGSSRYQDILGANEKIRIGVIGVNSRGKALAQGFAKLPDCEVTYICDVDSRALEKCQGWQSPLLQNRSTLTSYECLFLLWEYVRLFCG